MVATSIAEKATSAMEVSKTSPANSDSSIKSSKRRFWMLFIFSCESVVCGMMFTLYVCMADLNGCYYEVGQDAVNWTTMLVMAVYILLVFPVSALIDYIDLRWTIILGAVFNSAACAAQYGSLHPTGFAWVMVVVFLGSLSNVLVLGIPPFLAARWFPSHELSRASAMGVFGNQLGIALGFIFPPYMITGDCKKTDLVTKGKENVALITTAVNCVLLVLLLISFQNRPKHPPSAGEMCRQNETSVSHGRTVLNMLKNGQFILVLIVYGLVVGDYFALTTILNNLVLHYYKDKELEIGWMGFILIVAGLVGSIIAGYVMDYTHRFKETTLTICVLSLITHIVFSCLLHSEMFWIQFLTIGVHGFFLTSFLSVGFEYGIEVTYPESESICACLMNTSTMIFGIILTELSSHVQDKFGPVASMSTLAINLFIACIITGFITTEYKRTKKSDDQAPSIEKIGQKSMC